MSRFKKMWIAFGIIMVLGLLFYLVLSRKINPDRYFLLKTDKIPFREIMINVSKYAMEFEPQFKRGSYKLGLSRSVDIDKLYCTLYRSEYGFQVDASDQFILRNLDTDKLFVVGKVLGKEMFEEYRTVQYRIEIPEDYQAYHQEKEGMFPYYQIHWSMMSSTGGGFGYSWEANTLLRSPKGDSLQFYRGKGAIGKQDRLGIFPK
ncbi:hypothetical protein [Flagellimonas pelagia]|uniref:Uncharacterized protein n=1 Tax=Flagellimonas pelagia TaxID=2306998 RepID=A0A3A1NM92_9FLAO|nr:hypothetical protein [Allomuricauda maritima]RIV47550.1 hypothetical protein D2V05_00170 [Allomuricauda maritima]TXK01640.1 hypothetical protein FQ017_00165 [Allomuricauda maritima]